MRKSHPFFLLAATAIFAEGGGGAAGAAGQRAAAADGGRVLYTSQGCYQCHGLEGQGARGTGPALNPLRRDSASFEHYVRHPLGAMPPYSANILPAGDLRRIEAYIRSLPPKRPAASIALLSGYVDAAPGVSSDATSKTDAAPSLGRDLYERNCATCHGASREGGSAPALNGSRPRLDAGYIVSKMRSPPPGMPRFVPDILTELRARAVATFISDAK